jgi:Mg-chelatase subunit ChlD
VFNGFMDRTTAYTHPHHIGLVTFDSTVSIAQNITPVLEDFRYAMAPLETNGTTELMKALVECRKLLSECGQEYPSAKKRVFVLSDGQGNVDYQNLPWQVCRDLQVRHFNSILTSDCRDYCGLLHHSRYAQR